jgi:hypothetical protein
MFYGQYVLTPIGPAALRRAGICCLFFRKTLALSSPFFSPGLHSPTKKIQKKK